MEYFNQSPAKMRTTNLDSGQIKLGATLFGAAPSPPFGGAIFEKCKLL
jgi:hypothetical protein